MLEGLTVFVISLTCFHAFFASSSQTCTMCGMQQSWNSSPSGNSSPALRRARHQEWLGAMQELRQRSRLLKYSTERRTWHWMKGMSACRGCAFGGPRWAPVPPTSAAASNSSVRRPAAPRIGTPISTIDPYLLAEDGLRSFLTSFAAPGTSQQSARSPPQYSARASRSNEASLTAACSILAPANTAACCATCCCLSTPVSIPSTVSSLTHMCQIHSSRMLP